MKRGRNGRRRWPRRHCVDICQLSSKGRLAIWSSLHNCRYCCRRSIRARRPQYGVLKRLYPQSFLAGFSVFGQITVFLFSLLCGYTDSRAKKAARPTGSRESQYDYDSDSDSDSIRIASRESFSTQKIAWKVQIHQFSSGSGFCESVMMGISIYLNVMAALRCHDCCESTRNELIVFSSAIIWPNCEG